MNVDSLTHERIAALRPFLDNPSDATWQQAIDNALALTPVTVALHMEGGLVQYGRSDRAGVNLIVADMDVYEQCAGDLDKPCDPEEEPFDRQEHADHRVRFAQFNALPHKVY